MNIGILLRLIACVSIFCGMTLHAAAQTDPLRDPITLRVDYGKAYQLQDSYSILYDNAAQSAKLKDFRVSFYGLDGREIAETQDETHPLNGNIETYRLNRPVIGFSEVRLIVFSLHSGEADDFPTSISTILALNELAEVPEPKSPEPKPKLEPETLVPNVSPPAAATPPPPTLTEAEKQRLDAAAANISDLLTGLDEKAAALVLAAESRGPDTTRLALLIEDTAALSQRTDSHALPVLEPQIQALSTKMISAKTNAALTETQTNLGRLQTEALALQSQTETLLNLSKTEGADITNVMASLAEINAALEGPDGLDAKITAVNLPTAVTPAQLDAWQAVYVSLKNQLDRPAFNWPVFLLIGLAALAVLGLGAKALLMGKIKPRPLKSVLNHSAQSGVLFPVSPMLAGNVAAPLAPAGQLAAAQMQMLSGPYAVLREAYEATGRIGYAQVGVPTKEDYSFGTGFLVSDRHVVTNRHVHGLYGHYLLDKSDPGGIEFIAEKDKDASDFAPFNGEAPLLLPELDIAIYTLARPVKTRSPIQLKPIETEALPEREIVVIGYPDTHTPDNPEIQTLVEEDPVFAVKRLSQGRIFRHSTDMDAPFGVETSIAESKTSNFLMPAICHNASTMPGNSGSPLLDIKTGGLLGVHFAGFKVFNREEAANLAMAIAQLTQSQSLHSLSTVTPITDGNGNHA